MLTAIISDIHANHQALRAVIEHARTIDPSVQFWCLGDVFDRGPSPYEVWDDLRQIRNIELVAGNHDWGLFGRLGEASFPRKDDRESQLKQRKLLQQIGQYESIADIYQRIPVMASPLFGVYLAHASFGWFQPKPTVMECLDSIDAEHMLWGSREAERSNTWRKLKEFVSQPEPEPLFVKRTAEWTPPLLMAVGHTHIRAMIWLRDLRAEDIRVGSPIDLSLDSENPVLINPGSVGFCMNANDRCASYALLDWNDKKPRVYFHRVPYDRDQTIYLLGIYEYPDSFKEMLLKGDCRV